MYEVLGFTSICERECSCVLLPNSNEDIVMHCRRPNVFSDIPDLKDEKKMGRVKEL